MYQYFKTNEAVANQSGAMEAETISKNRRSSKSHKSRVNFKIFAFVILVAAGMITIKSCKKDDEKNVSQPVIDLISIGGVLPGTEGVIKGRTEEILSTTFDWERSDEEPDWWITRQSTEDVACRTFNTEWKIENVKVSASENCEDFAMVNPNANVLWPGNLVQGETVANGTPAPVSVPVSKRQPGNISLAIVSSAGKVGDPMYSKIDNWQSSTVTQAMNDILRGFPGHGFAQYYFEPTFIESQEDLEFSFNASFKGFGASAKAGLKANYFEKNTLVLIKLYQSYFTMVYDDPAGLNGVFTPDITVNDLSNYTGNGNPICYISSVTYGRIFYVLYESTAKRDSLEAALNISYKGYGTDISAGAKYTFQSAMEKTTASVFQLGGGAERSFTNAMALDLNEIKAFLERGANFSPESPGAPISYTVRYLKDARLVRMNNTMDYTVERRTPVKMERVVCPTLPEVTTLPVTTIYATSARVGGNITFEGTPSYFEHGVVLHTSPNPNPTLANKEVIAGATGTTRVFSSNIDGLTPLTKYYVRAYATSEFGTAWGKEESFETGDREEEPSIIPPMLTTNEPTNITPTSARLGGYITNVGSPAYIERGVVLAEHSNPTFENNFGGKRIMTGIGITGNFDGIIRGLTSDKMYWVRAYATNSAGQTTYGELRNFETGVSYIDANGTTRIRSLTSTPSITSETTELENGWYRVSGNVTVNPRIEVKGTVHLILEDDFLFTASRGINVTGSNSLIIYAQSTDANMGSLTATGEDGTDGGSGCGSGTGNGGTGGNAGIGSSGGSGGSRGGNGGNAGGQSGNITINGGKITANGGKSGTGGSGGSGCEGGGGGGGAGAGIGGGGGGGGGGRITNAAGGGGNGGAGGTIFINGGSVTAIGGDHGNGGTAGGGGGGGGGARAAGIGGGGGGGGGARNGAFPAISSGVGSAGSSSVNCTGSGGKGGTGGTRHDVSAAEGGNGGNEGSIGGNNDKLLENRICNNGSVTY